MSEPILSIRGLTKRFGGLVAVNNVDWDVFPGEVVALLGDNGAGKSTLIKCVSGVYQLDEGEIFFEGRPAHFARPIDARREGIETIYQELALANNLDVGANIFLGRPKIVRECSLPLTSVRPVSLVVTDLAVIEPTADGLVLKERVPGVSVAQIQESTKATLIVPDEVSEIALAA